MLSTSKTYKPSFNACKMLRNLNRSLGSIYPFLQSKLNFLGHIVSRKGIATDVSKMEKVATWPVPTSAKEVQQFLGLSSYYRRFGKGFADIARQLHELTAVFRWTQECQSAFNTLRTALTSTPVLAYPDYTRPFILDTDASNTGIGGALSQRDASGVITYTSQALSKQERGPPCCMKHF